MTISSWDSVYYLGLSLGMKIDDIYEISKWLMPDDNGGSHDLDVFIKDSVIGLDKKSLVVGAMVSSIIMGRVYVSSEDGAEVVRCIVCGNHCPVAMSNEDDIGWVCSDCSNAYDNIRRRIESISVKRHGTVSNLYVIVCDRIKNLWRKTR